MNAKALTRLTAFLFAVLAAYMVVGEMRTAHSTPYSRGMVLARQSGCTACHGGPGLESAANPSSVETVPDSHVPGIVGTDLSAEEFEQWVLDGARDGLRDSERWLSTSAARAIKMPAYRDSLNADQVADIHAWSLISGHQGATKNDATSSKWARAEALAESLGCFACHGVLGQGGVANPGAFTSEIPALVGEDFEHLTNGAERLAIREWIRDGASERFLASTPLGFLGRGFMERQKTKMPAFGGVLSDEEVELLIDYCLYMNELGPLAPADYLGYVEELHREVQVLEPLLADEPSAGAELPGDVHEIFSRACISCHGPQKQKSGYRLDNRESAFTSGEISSFTEVPVITPGDPEASLLYKFIIAEEESLEEEIFPMPPKQGERLTSDEVASIKQWILDGAPWGNEQVIRESQRK